MELSWSVEIEPEVRAWLDTLTGRDYLRVEHAVERWTRPPP